MCPGMEMIDKDQFASLHVGEMEFLSGGGEMANLIRAKDWAATPLGPIESWPQSLRTTVSLCLASNFPINIIWGPRHTQIYNDGYRIVCGEGHPTFLGMDYSVSWASAWPAIGAPFESALGGQTCFLENQRMFLHRNGYLEETFFTFSISPIRDESGGIGGLFHPVTETTATMLGERRTRAVRDLTTCLAQAKTTDEVFGLAANTLAEFAFDLPFVLIYQLDETAQPERPGGLTPRYKLAASTGLSAGTSASPQMLESDTWAPWPLVDLVDTQAAMVINGLSTMLRSIPCGPYDEAPDIAVAIPISLPGSDLPAAILIAGASARLPFDDAYRGFQDLIAAALGAGLANAKAYEQERRRAEALAAIDHAKTAFFSNVSHEFRTPLTLILGPIEDALADTEALSAPQRERLQATQRNALRLLKLVNTLLDFSRIEAGRAEARFEPVDLAAFTADLASNFRSACKRGGISLSVECPALPVPVYVDRDMWEKIVLNLVSNAFKFTLEGGITVALRTRSDMAELVVRDTGVGIPAEELPRIFERFHRVDGQRGRTHEGTGIGLALVDGLVKLHGGEISVSSVAAQGTEFRITVPLGTAHLPADRIHAPREPIGTSARANPSVVEALSWLPERDKELYERLHDAGTAALAGAPRIILADDNADMRAYVSRILLQAGYAVEAVKDGVAAVAAARREPADLLLADVMMPELDGFGVLRELRSEPAMDGLLIILLSARAGEEARVEGLTAGADDYLVKPFNARELRARVDGAVRLARQRREATAREHDLRMEIATQRGRADLRESEQRLEFALQAGRLGSWELDLVTRRLVPSKAPRAKSGRDPSKLLDTSDSLLNRVHPEDRALQRAAIDRAMETGLALHVEYRVLHPNGHIAWVEVRGHAVYAEDGTPRRMTGVSLDITARKLAEERQKLLLNELNHRVKNTLATVQSIAMQTQRNAKTPAMFSKDLGARIEALARGHDLLTRASWDGASLAEIIGQTMVSYLKDAEGNHRVEACGPNVRLGPNAAVSLNMAFHELATNAAKYGALSVRGGRVSVRWNIKNVEDETSIDLTWCEVNGPKVGPPSRRGFGSRLLERGLVAELGGEVHLDFAPEGVCCHMRLPISHKIALAT